MQVTYTMILGLRQVRKGKEITHTSRLRGWEQVMGKFSNQTKVVQKSFTNLHSVHAPGSKRWDQPLRLVQAQAREHVDTPESCKAAPLGAQNRKEQPNIYKRVAHKPLLTVVKKRPTASVDPHITSATKRHVEDEPKSIRRLKKGLF